MSANCAIYSIFSNYLTLLLLWAIPPVGPQIHPYCLVSWLCHKTPGKLGMVLAFLILFGCITHNYEWTLNFSCLGESTRESIWFYQYIANLGDSCRGQWALWLVMGRLSRVVTSHYRYQLDYTTQAEPPGLKMWITYQEVENAPFAFGSGLKLWYLIPDRSSTFFSYTALLPDAHCCRIAPLTIIIPTVFSVTAPWS